MTPIEKATAKSDAHEALGVERGATASQIRSAWRRLAFGRHPDKAPGSKTDFARARDAYDLLISEAEAMSAVNDAAAPRDGAPVSRPQVAGKVTALTEAALGACGELLDRSRKTAPGLDPNVLDLTGGALPPETLVEHVPDRVEQRGRHLVFHIGSVLEPGAHRVALPTAMLRDPRKVAPQLLTLLVADEGRFELDLPRELVGQMVPGARSLRVVFAGDGD